ncbi:MAG: hypothetical protein ACPL5F_09995 [Moorellaceae bacterium]
MSLNELAGLLALIDLLGILNLWQGNIPAQGKARSTLQEALNAVLSAQEGPGGSLGPSDLAAALGGLGKNPALINSLLHLLLHTKEPKVKDKEKDLPEGKPTEESQTQRPTGRSR